MRNRFRYFAPRASNAATYGIALTLLLAARAHWADLWPTLTSLVPMPVLFVGGGVPRSFAGHLLRHDRSPDAQVRPWPLLGQAQA
jgi:hypothetical protein